MRRLLSRRTQFLAVGLAAAVALSLSIGAMLLNGRTAHAGGPGGVGNACAANANGQPRCHFSGFSAQASFGVSDDCTFTTVQVFVADNIIHDQPGQPNGGPFVGVSIFKGDFCQFTFSDLGGTTTSDITLHTTGALDSATVSAVVPVQDFANGTSGTVSVNLTWHGFGSLDSSIDTQHIRSEHFSLHSHVVADNRTAAYSGTVSDGTTTYNLNGTSFLFSVKSGDLIVTHP